MGVGGFDFVELNIVKLIVKCAFQVVSINGEIIDVLNDLRIDGFSFLAEGSGFKGISQMSKGS